MSKPFKLEIYTPDRVFFKGEADALVVNTVTGEMGVLYHTLPLVTILAQGVMRITQNGKLMEAFNSEGFINVSRECVTVLTESALWPHEIDDSGDEAEDEESAEDLSRRKARSFAEYKLTKAQLALQFAKLKTKDKSR